MHAYEIQAVTTPTSVAQATGLAVLAGHRREGNREPIGCVGPTECPTDVWGQPGTRPHALQGVEDPEKRTHGICTPGTAPAQTCGSTDLASGHGGRPGKGMSGCLSRMVTPVLALLYLTSSALTRGHVPIPIAIAVSGLPAADLVPPDEHPRGNAFTWSDLQILTWAPPLQKESPFSPNTSKVVTEEGSYSKG